MRETYLAVAGVVATDPTVRELDDGKQVLSFRLASTSRRFDAASKAWSDGPTTWVRVTCWRELADNASQCVRKRDRVVAWGRIRTEQWQAKDGGLRSDLSLEAEALGHDLTFGVSTFDRKRRTVAQRTLTEPPVFDEQGGDAAGAEPDGAQAPAVAPRGPGADELDEFADLELSEEEELVGSV